MRKRFSIYYFLVAIMVFSLVLPGFAGAEVNGSPKGSLTIHKFEKEPNSDGGVDGDGSANQPAPGTALEGVTFTLTQTHSYNPSTDIWTKVDGNPDDYVTGSDGKIVINNIPLGRYTVQETEWPANVVGNDKKYTVDIPMTNKEGTDVNYDVHIYPKNETV